MFTKKYGAEVYKFFGFYGFAKSDLYEMALMNVWQVQIVCNITKYAHFYPFIGFIDFIVYEVIVLKSIFRRVHYITSYLGHGK